MNIVRLIILSLCGMFALAGCSYQQTLDAMVSPARQGEIIRAAELLCSNIDGLQGQFDPTIVPQLNASYRAQIQARCPTETNTIWRLTNYEFSASAEAGAATRRTEAAAVVAGDVDGPWTEFQLNYLQTGDAAPMLVNFTLERFDTRPESLTGVEAWDSARYYVAAVVTLLALIPILLILWFIRRRRRRRNMTGV